MCEFCKEKREKEVDALVIDNTPVGIKKMSPVTSSSIEPLGVGALHVQQAKGHRDRDEPPVSRRGRSLLMGRGLSVARWGRGSD